MTRDDRDRFREHVRPRLMELLGAVGLDVVYHRGRGDYLYTRGESGEEIAVLDLLGGFGATLFGHNHPALVARARAILDEERPMLAQASARALAGRLAEALSERVGRTTGRRYVATFASTGAEAVEAALKHAELEAVTRLEARLAETERLLARARAGVKDGRLVLANGETLESLAAQAREGIQRALSTEPIFLAVERAFHGKTTGALKLTFNPDFRTPWRRLGPRVRFVPVGDEAALAAALEEATIDARAIEISDGRVGLVDRRIVNVAAILAEPVQGEGGIHELAPAFLAALRRAADAGGFPLVFDEIQSGMGRTGTFLASEPSGVRADYYLFSKALGGGLAKIAALLVDHERYVPEFGYVHTSTFADDDPSCAIALAALELLDEERLAERCREKGERLLGRLRALASEMPHTLRAVRGRGLLLGVELAPQVDSPSPLLRVLAEQDLLGPLLSGYLLATHRIRVAPTLSSRSTIRIEPSAYVPVEELDRFVDALRDVLEALRDGDVARLLRHVTGATPSAEAPSPADVRSRAMEPPERARRGKEVAAAPPDVPRIAFLAHFLEPRHLAEWEPALDSLDDAALERFLDRTRGILKPFHVDDAVVTSATGEKVIARIIGVPFTPAQVTAALRAGDPAWAVALVEQGVALARRLGCRIVGFGGYTSIVTENCTALAADDLAFTSGNSLTAVAALEALFAVGRRLGARPARLGVIGAAGNIGAVLAELAADWVDELVLVGRKAAVPRLSAVAAALAGRTAVRIETDLSALRGCNLIVSATNAPRPILLPEHIGEGPVAICDVAAPRDVDPRVAEARPRAVVFQGGVVRLPAGQRLNVPGLALDRGQVYGCLAETLLLGLAGVTEHFSYGPLAADRLRRIRELARRHGFAIEPPEPAG